MILLILTLAYSILQLKCSIDPNSYIPSLTSSLNCNIVVLSDDPLSALSGTRFLFYLDGAPPLNSTSLVVSGKWNGVTKSIQYNNMSTLFFSISGPFTLT